MFLGPPAKGTWVIAGSANVAEVAFGDDTKNNPSEQGLCPRTEKAGLGTRAYGFDHCNSLRRKFELLGSSKVSRRFIHAHFDIKSARLSGLGPCCCCPERSACRPALRFFARFLLVALAVGFGASLVTGAIAFIFDGCPSLRRAAGPGAVISIFVCRLQKPQDTTLTGPLSEATCCAEGLRLFLREAVRLASLTDDPVPGRWILPQAPHTR